MGSSPPANNESAEAGLSRRRRVGTMVEPISRSSGDSIMGWPRARRNASSASAQRRSPGTVSSSGTCRLTPSSGSSSRSTCPNTAAKTLNLGRGSSHPPDTIRQGRIRLCVARSAASRCASSDRHPGSVRKSHIDRHGPRPGLGQLVERLGKNRPHGLHTAPSLEGVFVDGDHHGLWLPSCNRSASRRNVVGIVIDADAYSFFSHEDGQTEAAGEHGHIAGGRDKSLTCQPTFQSRSLHAEARRSGSSHRFRSPAAYPRSARRCSPRECRSPVRW